MRLFVVALGFAMAACGGGDDAPVDDPDAAVVDELLEPPPAGEGFQLAMTTQLGAGVEAEHCMFVKGPPETFFLNRDEVRFTAGSHHFLVYETAYTEIPTEKEDGTPVDTSGVFDCTNGPTDGWRIVKLLGGSQNGTGDSIVRFPPGVAMEVAGGRVLLLNAHYVNASDSPLEPEIRINMWTIPEADVTELGDVLFIYNPIIRVRAGMSERARWQCPVHQDITVANVQSHMHARGVGYAAAVRGEEPFYTNDKWEDVPVRSFDPGLQIAAGEVFDYYCDYENTEPQDIYQGAKSTDEMCMLIGSYYPADARTSNCLNAAGTGFGGVWVGNGTATCATTADCYYAAFGAGNVLRALTDCVLDADPAVAVEASALLECIISSDNPLADCTTESDACASL